MQFWPIHQPHPARSAQCGNRVSVRCARNLNASLSRDRKVSWSKLKTVNYSGFEPPQEGHLPRQECLKESRTTLSMAITFFGSKWSSLDGSWLPGLGWRLRQSGTFQSWLHFRFKPLHAKTPKKLFKDTLQRQRSSTFRAFPSSPVRWAASAPTTRKKSPARPQGRQWSACPGH